MHRACVSTTSNTVCFILNYLLGYPDKIRRVIIFKNMFIPYDPDTGGI
jgi:hypothetical protein